MNEQMNSLVLAAPERKRILRDLLNRWPQWSRADGEMYREMIRGEWKANMRDIDHVAAAEVEKEVFIGLASKGISADVAMERATAITDGLVRDLKKDKRGQQERDRRRKYREAVTELRGGDAVTHLKWGERMENCIICGKVMPYSKPATSAYCGNACRQKAYRRRTGSTA